MMTAVINIATINMIVMMTAAAGGLITETAPKENPRAAILKQREGRVLLQYTASTKEILIHAFLEDGSPHWSR